MSYLNLGFDQFLQRIPQDPIQQLDPQQFAVFTDQISGDKMDSEIGGNFIGSGINAKNITAGLMSFDRASGGTLGLGGNKNQNGVFSLKDQNNVEKIKMDKDGMTINDGSMVIKNQDNNTIIDADGLVSTNSFNANTINVSLKSTTSGTYVDIPGTSFNLILKRKTRILFMLNIDSHFTSMGGSSAAALYGLNIDGSIINSNIILTYTDNAIGVTGESSATDSRYWMLSGQNIITLNPGAHSFSVMHKILRTGSEVLNLNELFLTYLILGS